MNIVQKYRALRVITGSAAAGMVLGGVGGIGGLIHFAVQIDAYRELSSEIKRTTSIPEGNPLLMWSSIVLVVVSGLVAAALVGREHRLGRIVDELDLEEGFGPGRDELRKRAHKRLRELARALDRAERCEKGEIPPTDLEVEALIDPEEFRTKFKELHKACVQEKIIEDAGQGRFFREEA